MRLSLTAAGRRGRRYGVVLALYFLAALLAATFHTHVGCCYPETELLNAAVAMPAVHPPAAPNACAACEWQATTSAWSGAAEPALRTVAIGPDCPVTPTHRPAPALRLAAGPRGPPVSRG